MTLDHDFDVDSYIQNLSRLTHLCVMSWNDCPENHEGGLHAFITIPGSGRHGHNGWMKLYRCKHCGQLAFDAGRDDEII